MDEDVGEVYEKIEELFEIVGKNSNIIFMDDFNASEGSIKKAKYRGKFGIEETNSRGKRFARIP